MHKIIKSIILDLGDRLPVEMIAILLIVIAVEAVAIAFLSSFASKRKNKFKRAEQNFTNYLDKLDKENYRLKVRLAKFTKKNKLLPGSKLS